LFVEATDDRDIVPSRSREDKERKTERKRLWEINSGQRRLFQSWGFTTRGFMRELHPTAPRRVHITSGAAGL
jgi:hypothetical protein